MARSPRLALAVLALATLPLAACGGDDGASVREVGSGSGSGAASGSGSGSGSGTGLSTEDSSGKTSSNPKVAEAVTQYTAWVRQQGDQIVTEAKQLTDAVRAGDLEAAKAAYAPSRQSWERIEPIAGLVEEIDGKVDARVDDFENEDDPEFTGWHRIEYLLFSKGDIAAAVPFAARLDADLQTLQRQLATLEIPADLMAVGASELIEEVSGGKITGEEDRYSGTDLWDFAANVEGSQQAYDLLRPALVEVDESLASEIDAGFTELGEQLAAYRDGEGYRPYSALTEEDKAAMKTTLADLSEHLADVAGALELS